MVIATGGVAPEGDALGDQGGVDLEGDTIQRDGAVFLHVALLLGEEDVVDVIGRDADAIAGARPRIGRGTTLVASAMSSIRYVCR